MLINNVEIEEYGAQLLDRAISTASVHSVTQWLDGAAFGVLLRQNRDWHNLRLTFLITETSEDAAYKRIAVLTEVLKHCVLRFDDIQLDFTCALEGTSNPERLQNGVFKVSFTLKNYHATEEEIIIHREIAAINAKKIKISYFRSWADTMGYYVGCFDRDEIYEKVGEEELYIDVNAIEAKASGVNSWNTLFLNLGVDINKYKSINEQNGFVDIKNEYSVSNALTLFNNNDHFIIYYNRMQMDGFPDLPAGKVYPSLAWRAPGDNNYYFQTDVGAGWNVQDVSILIIGRYFRMRTATNGSMFGAGNGLSLWNTTEKAYYIVGDPNSYYTFNVFNSESSGSGGLTITTLEDISSTPMRIYGIKSTNEGVAPIAGYTSLKFNGTTLSEVSAPDEILTSNIMIGRGFNAITNNNTPVQNADIARVQIYHKGELVRDYIPVLFNLKNGFYNNYDTGMYDIINMKYLPWSGNAGLGPTPGSGLMPIPDQSEIPDSPTPPVAESYSVIVSNGSGSGTYEPGALVTIAANPPSTGKVFSHWTISGVQVSNNTVTTLTFYMPENNVTATANYVDSSDTPPDDPSATYTVIANSASGGGTYSRGDLVLLTANEPINGYVFNQWEITGITIDNLTSTSISFYMPANNVTATATYIQSSEPHPTPDGAHNLNVINGSGSGKYYFGTRATIIANSTSPEGYPFKNWQIEGITVSDPTQQVIVFTMPNNDVTATAIYYSADEPIEIDGGWLLYWTPQGSRSHNYNTEQSRGQYALDWETDARSMYDNGYDYYAFVFATPNVTPSVVRFYSTNRIAIGTPTRDKWGRYLIPWRATTGLSGKDQYIQGTIGNTTYKKTFFLRSLF